MGGFPISIEFPLSAPLASALSQLLRARDYAHDAVSDPWQFSVELEPLQRMGMTLNDLRWLLAKEFVEHAREVTAPGDDVRTFRPLSGTEFPAGTCLRLTESGVRMFRGLVMNQPVAGGIEQATPSGLVAPAGRVQVRPDCDTNATEYPLPAEPRHFVREQRDRAGSGPSRVVRNGPGEASAANSPPDRNVDDDIGPTAQPVWDSILRELRLGDRIVKRFRVPAANQELVLTVFEEDGWPSSIDDPLPPSPDIDPKRRLQSTVKSLNRNQIAPLLRFHANGNARRVTWELDEHATHDATTP